MSDRFVGNGVVADSEDVTIPVLLRSSSDNTAKTGVAHSDVTGSYWREGGSRTEITMSNLASMTASHSDGGWEEVDSTNMPGHYRFDIPDAAFNQGADWVIITAKGSDFYIFSQKFHIDTRTTEILSSSATSQILALTGGVLSGTVGASGASDNNVHISDGVAIDDQYNGMIITIVSGTGIGQSRLIIDYDGTTKIATIYPNWITNPVINSVYLVHAWSYSEQLRSYIVQEGKISAATDVSVTLSADESPVTTNNYYENCGITITDGTGAGQARRIASYAGATRIALISPAWATNPDSTSRYKIFSNPSVPSKTAETHQYIRKYGTESTIIFNALNTEDGSLQTGVTFALGDIQISKDGGAFANVSNSATSIGNGYYSLVLTATEMQHARAVISIIDQGSPKSYIDQLVEVETFGNSSGEFDLNILADYIHRRDLGNILASSDGDTKAFRSLAGAVSKLVNKVEISGTDLTVYEDDDSTVLGTQNVTTDSSAEPITAVDTT